MPSAARDAKKTLAGPKGQADIVLAQRAY